MPWGPPVARRQGRRDGWPGSGPARSPFGGMETGNCHIVMASFGGTSRLHPRHCPLGQTGQTAGKAVGQDTLSTHKPHPSNCTSCLHQQHPPQPHITNILPAWVPPSPSSSRTPKPTIFPITSHSLAPLQPPLAPALQRPHPRGCQCAAAPTQGTEHGHSMASGTPAMTTRLLLHKLPGSGTGFVCVDYSIVLFNFICITNN